MVGNDQSGSGTVISSDRWPSAEIEGRIMRKLYRCVYLWRMMEQVRLERPRAPGGGQFKTPQGGSELGGKRFRCGRRREEGGS